MQPTAFSTTTSVALFVVGALMLSGGASGLACCLQPCDRNADPTCKETW